MTSILQNAPLDVLLADDDKDDRFFFAEALNELPIETHLTVVNNGEQLMDYLLAHLDCLPDVLFLDLSMPRKSGFECLPEIKEDTRLKDIPLIMLSTAFPRDINYEQGLVQTLFNMGAEGFMRKQSNLTLLKNMVHQSLIKVMDNKKKIPPQ